jgi:hypothetical protein
MSIPVRKDGQVIASVDLVGIDIDTSGTFLVVERTDNQNQFRLAFVGPENAALVSPPEPAP